MATRRSRIKAVANLPARRSRPSAQNEIKKENADGQDVFTSSQTTGNEVCVKALELEGKEKGDSPNQSDASLICHGTPDRKSVIVTADKDRQCVIVNSSSSTEDNQENSLSTQEPTGIHEQNTPPFKCTNLPEEYLTKTIQSDVLPQQEASEIAAKRKQSSNAQRVAAARRSLKSRLATDGGPPRSRLTMFDLIFYNPSKNPMIPSDSPPKKLRPRVNSLSSVSSIHEDRLNEESVDDVGGDKSQDDDEEDVAMPVPQVKVGPDGSLILDEKSLVIETTGTKKSREELENSEVVIDTKTSYGHYKKVVRSKDWSDYETKKFYRALNVVGTDFSLMKPYFRKRSRRELKLKFKKEERFNPNLVNKALGEHLDFDISELEKECELEDEEEKRLEEMEKEKSSEIPVENSDGVQENCKKLPRKTFMKRSRLMAEMDLESETPSKKPLKNSIRKSKKIVDTNAEKDYSLLAIGVDLPTQNNTKQISNTGLSKLDNLPQKPKKNSKRQVASNCQNQLPQTENSACSENNKPVKTSKRRTPNLSAIEAKNISAASGISPLLPSTVILKPNTVEAVAVPPGRGTPVICHHASSVVPDPKSPSSVNVAQIAGIPIATTVNQVPSIPQLQNQIRQASPLTPPLSQSHLVVSGMSTPRTVKIVTRQPSYVQPTVTAVQNPGMSSVINLRSPSLTAPISQAPIGPVPALVPSTPPQMSTPGHKVVLSSPLSRVPTVQVTPQNLSSFGVSTPVSRLLPSTPSLPRMEPGSIIVLKTPLPQNPDRHVLQVFMVTNTPQASSQNPVSQSPNLSPLNLLTGPTVQPASSKSPCISDDSDCEKVLTKL